MTYYTIKEVAQQLRTHHMTIREWVQEGKIPAVDLTPESSRRTWRIREDELVEALGHHTNQAAEAEKDFEEIV